MNTRGSQTKQIKAIMSGKYANMITEQTQNRMNGAIIGLVGGLILGSLLRQNALMVGLIGGTIGYLLSNKEV